MWTRRRRKTYIRHFRLVHELETTFTAGKPIAMAGGAATPAPDAIQLVATNKFQDILGFGGCFSDAACYVISQLHEPAREKLLHEMFHPSEMGLSVNRTCIGAADSAATLYSYDDGDADPELKRFSIDHDREYIFHCCAECMRSIQTCFISLLHGVRQAG